MTPPTDKRIRHGSVDAQEIEIGEGDTTLAGGVDTDRNNANEDHEANTTAEATPLPSVEAMEDLILEAYNNMQSDGEHIFLPSDVASKLQLIAELVKGAGYASDDLVSNSSESNQEESARLLPPSDQQHTAPPSVASSAPASPPNHSFALADDELFAHVSHLRLDDHRNSPAATPEQEGKPIEPLVLESNNFVDHECVAPTIPNNSEFGPALSPVQEIAEDLLSVSDLDSVTGRTQDNLAPPKPSSPLSRERSNQDDDKHEWRYPPLGRSNQDDEKPKWSSPPRERPDEKPKSRLRKPEIHRKPGRPSSVTKSQDSNKAPSSGTRSHTTATRVKIDTHTPPTSRDRSTSSSYEQRREAAQKLKEEKAHRELAARESARKQREDARRKLEEAQQKEMAAKRERVARMRMQKDLRKGPVKPSPGTK